MLTDYTAAKFWLDVAQIAAVLVLFVYTWWQNKSKATAGAIQEVDSKHVDLHQNHEQRMDQHAERLLILEKDIKALPREEHISDLYMKMNSLNREMGELASALSATNGLLKIHQDYLMNKKA